MQGFSCLSTSAHDEPWGQKQLLEADNQAHAIDSKAVRDFKGLILGYYWVDDYNPVGLSIS
jgi:hypothetical protein